MTNKRLWTRGTAFAQLPSFSADGSRVAFADVVVDTRTGAIVNRREHLGLTSSLK